MKEMKEMKVFEVLVCHVVGLFFFFFPSLAPRPPHQLQTVPHTN
jgi:hypothetical protein